MSPISRVCRSITGYIFHTVQKNIESRAADERVVRVSRLALFEVIVGRAAIPFHLYHDRTETELCFHYYRYKG